MKQIPQCRFVSFIAEVLLLLRRLLLWHPAPARESFFLCRQECGSAAVFAGIMCAACSSKNLIDCAVTRPVVWSSSGASVGA